MFVTNRGVLHLLFANNLANHCFEAHNMMNLNQLHLI